MLNDPTLAGTKGILGMLPRPADERIIGMGRKESDGAIDEWQGR